MSWWTCGRTLYRATACLALVVAGCAASSIGEPAETGGQPPAPDELAPGGRGGRRDFGLGDRMALFALADTHSSISPDSSPFRFTDIIEGSGIDFVHFSGMDDEKNYPTAFGSGAAMFDCDGDGRLDLYFATCTLLP